MKRISFILVLTVAIMAIVPAFAIEMGTDANPNIGFMSIYIDHAMYTYFSCTANAVYTIYVESATLWKLENNIWVFVCNLPPPTRVVTSSNYDASIDYSSYCQRGNKYKITAVFYAGGSRATCSSAGVTY